MQKINGRYKVDIRPTGRNGPRFRKSFESQGEALAYERFIMANHAEAKPWQEKRTDSRRLAELITVWYDLHGKQLKRGGERSSYLHNIALEMNNPRAVELTPKHFADFRAQRLKGKQNPDGTTTAVKPVTVNHDLMYLKALFNELERLGEWQHGNPFAKIRRLKIDDLELSFLELDEIETLLNALDKSPDSHARITARVCLATGARWGEACTLKASQVRNGKVTFTGTKSGKNRTVPIPRVLEALILAHTPLVDGLNTFKRTVATLDLELPKGQMTHVLRHTFASHFIMNGGNILALQKILGHGSLQMTMRYAHLSPDHLNEVLELNPLAQCY